MEQLAEKVALRSKADTQNPKDLLGIKKVSFTKIPFPAIAEESLAMMDGGMKYGPYNWRDKKVIASIYIDAALRHIALWFEGEERAEDSGAHHLGHARACMGILLDAMATGNLVDDRPVNESSQGELGKIFKEMEPRIAALVKKNSPPQRCSKVNVLRGDKPQCELEEGHYGAHNAYIHDRGAILPLYWNDEGGRL